MTNKVTGTPSTAGLSLTQEADGGSGGLSYGGTAGAAGAATSSLTFNDVTANPTHLSETVTGAARAIGGAGGSGQSGSAGVAGGTAARPRAI